MTRYRSQAAKLACAVLLATTGATACSSTDVRAASARAAGVASRTVPRVTPQASLASGPPGICTTADLSVSVSASGEHDDDGTKVARFVLTDTATDACTLTGSPGISMNGLVAAGDAEPEVNLAVSQQDVPSELGAIAQPGGTYTLQPGGTAAFFIAWYPASSVVCEDGEGFGFNAPGDTDVNDSSSVDYPFGDVCDGLFYVSQVFSSTTQG